MGPLKLVSGSEDVINHRATLISESNKEKDSGTLGTGLHPLRKEKEVKREKRALQVH